MRRTRLLLAAVSLLAAAALAGCGGDADSPTESDAEAAAPASETPAEQSGAGAQGGAGGGSGGGGTAGDAPSGTAVTTGDSEFGEMLFDTQDQAIYLFDIESDGTPRCYGACAVDWPPVLTTSAPAADGDVDPGLLGTVERTDGTDQVTYNGWPLYFYADEGPGEVLCHDFFEYDGLWLAVGPDGDPLPV